MRIIPKKIKVKNTVWKCYSMPDIIVADHVFDYFYCDNKRRMGDSGNRRIVEHSHVYAHAGRDFLCVYFG